MSHTIVDQDHTIHIRAVIMDRTELQELVDKLQKRLDGKPVDITTGPTLPKPGED